MGLGARGAVRVRVGFQGKVRVGFKDKVRVKGLGQC